MEDKEQILEELKSRIFQLEESLKKLKADYSVHQHNNVDGTNVLRKDIELDEGQFLSVGKGGQGSAPITNLGTTAEQIQYSLSVSKDNRRGFVNKLDTLQLNLLHLPNNTSKQSFITAFRGPVVSPNPGQTISVTSGGNTVTINGFNFTTNELAGAMINIINSSGTFVESRTITSNTSTVITISGTWGASTSGGTFFIYTPIFLGSADTIFQRFYTQEGTDGGIRFGVGPTAGGQNGLLYSDATGDLYWRNKGGTSVKLN